MDYKAQYRELVNDLERLGGDLRGVPRYYSLEAEAKVRRLIKERQGGEPPRANSGKSPQTKDKGELPFAPTVGGEQAKREDLIADYPVVLHGVYTAKREAWLSACSLKFILNAIPIKEEKKAREIQRELWKLFEAMDNYDVILNYWKEHKKILEPQKENYSHLTAIELVQRRNTLRSNIVSREKNLSKWEEQAKSEEGKTSRSLWVLKEKIARKREELEQIKLQVKEIEKLITVPKGEE